MKTLKLKDVQAHFETVLDEARSQSLLITRRGNPVALIIGVEGHDLENLLLETDPAFWAIIEERRQQPTMRRAELDEYLRKRNRTARRSARARH